MEAPDTPAIDAANRIEFPHLFTSVDPKHKTNVTPLAGAEIVKFMTHINQLARFVDRIHRKLALFYVPEMSIGIEYKLMGVMPALRDYLVPPIEMSLDEISANFDHLILHVFGDTFAKYPAAVARHRASSNDLIRTEHFRKMRGFINEMNDKLALLNACPNVVNYHEFRAKVTEIISADMYVNLIGVHASVRGYGECVFADGKYFIVEGENTRIIDMKTALSYVARTSEVSNYDQTTATKESVWVQNTVGGTYIDVIGTPTLTKFIIRRVEDKCELLEKLPY